MSIKVMTEVWEHSQEEGGSLLVLLALADHANDQGYCWPSVPTLAKKARLSERHIRRILAELQDTGELVVERRKGRSNYYRVMTPRLRGDKMSGVEKEGQNVTPDAHVRGAPDAHVTPPLTPMSGEPSRNHQSNRQLKAQQMFSALAEVCDINWQIATESGRKGKGALNESEKILREAGVNPQDLRAFGDWWYEHDWRGQKGQSPTPAQVRQEWGAFEKHRNRSRYRMEVGA